MDIFTNTDGTMSDEDFSALGEGLNDKSDEYLAGYAEGVQDAVNNLSVDVTDALMEIHMTSHVMHEFIAERLRRNATKAE